MGSLVETIKNPEQRKAVVADCDKLIQEEVSAKKGLSGMAVKSAFKMIRSFKPDIVPNAMEDLLDEFAEKIDPYWQECQQQGANPESYFAANDKKIANSLLTVTDGRAQKSKHKILVKAYNGLRGKAVAHISAAMPRFSKLVVKHAS